MLPGPDQIVACPHCEGLARHMTLMSGNTIGATTWTDGKQIAPMLPRPPAVVKCHKCNECYWLSDADVVGSLRPFGSDESADPEWKAAPYVEEPSEEEFYQAIEKNLAQNADQEQTLRIFAWWRRNDAFRDHLGSSSENEAPLSEAGRKNLEALVPLLGTGDDNDKLMQAEVLRELGDFKGALQALGEVASGEYQGVVQQIRSLCESGSTRVTQLQFGN